MKKTKLNFACGNDIRKGWVNMDVAKLKGVNVVHDFNKFPYPFKASTFSEVYGRHAFEHVNDLIEVMEELSRVLKKKGKVKIVVPYFASPNSCRDPTHQIWFTSQTFSYFQPGYWYSKAIYKVVKRRICFFSSPGKSFMKSAWYSWPIDVILTAVLPIYERFFPYWFPASEIHFLLEVQK